MQKRRNKRRARHPGGRVPNYRLWLLIALPVAVIVLLLVFLRPSDSLLSSPEIARAQRLGVLHVGVRTDAPGFAEDGEGLEVEIARRIAERMFPDTDPAIALELTPVTYYTALPRLAEGDIDLALAEIWSADDTGYAYSGAYYKDSVRLVCRNGSESEELTGQNVGLIKGSAADHAWNSFGVKHPKATQAVYYASYPDLVIALKAGKIEFIGAAGAEVPALLKEGLSLHRQTLGYVQYVAASQADSSAFALFADLTIQDMIKDGSMQNLISEYGLAQYQYTGE